MSNESLVTKQMGIASSKSEGEISTTESISDLSNASINSNEFKDVKDSDKSALTLPTTQQQNPNDGTQQKSASASAMLNVVASRAAVATQSMDSQPSKSTIENANVSTEVLDIKQMLSQFNDTINKKIEDSQEHFTKKIEDSQRQFREFVVNDIKDAIANDVLKPLKQSIEQANVKIASLETDHSAKIEKNSLEIERSKREMECHISELKQKIITLTTQPNTTGSVTTHAINPAILGRQNNVIIAGLKEETGENLSEEVKKLATELEIEITTIKTRRLGKTAPNKVRPVLVEFTSHWEKRKFYSAKSTLKKKKMDKIFFNEDLDKESAKLYYLGRNAKKADLIKSIWTYGCQVFFTRKGPSTQPILLTNESQLPSATPRSASPMTTPANDIVQSNATESAQVNTAESPSE